MLTNKELDAIEDRVRNATGGPWRVDRNECVVAGRDVDFPDRVAVAEWKGDSEFIAHAREDVPALLASIRELRDELIATQNLDDRDEQVIRANVRLADLRAQRDAVLELHADYTDRSNEHRMFCREDGEPWPCPTARALGIDE